MNVGKTFQTQEEYDAYAASGMNILLVDGDTGFNDTPSQQDTVKSILAMAHKSGLKVIMHDSRIHKLSMSETPIVGEGCQYATQEALNAQVATWMCQYAELDGFYGLQLKDEPNYKMLPAMGAVYKAIKAYKPDCFVQCNLLPLDSGTVANYAEGATAATVEESYKAYLKAFIDNTGADYILFDSYPLLPNGIRGYHVRNLQIAAEFCKENGVELHSFVQSCAYTDNGVIKRRAAEEDDMYWQTNLLMAMGVKTVVYYTYQTNRSNSTDCMHQDGAAFMNWDGTKTDMYTYMTRIHSEMQALAPIILKYDYNGMAVWNASSVAANVVNSSSFEMLSISNVNVEDTEFAQNLLNKNKALLITEMYNEAGEYGYMILNLNDPANDASVKAKLTFKSNSVSVYTKGVCEEQTLPNGEYSVTLASGQAVFVVVG